VNNLGSYSGASPAFPQGKSPTSSPMMWLKGVDSSSLVLSLELALALWPVKTKTCLYTFSYSSTFTNGNSLYA